MKKFKEILEAKDPEYVIQDNGKSFKLANGMSLPRYGVWKIVTAKGKSEVVDTGDDLNALKKKYKTDVIFKVKA